jgi:RNA polymerase sigma-54 factor
MALGPRLDLRQSQSLVMTPQLQQAIKLLALSNIELEAFIAEEIERNPLLELESDGGDGPDLAPASDMAPAPEPSETGTDQVFDGASATAAESLDADFTSETFHHDSVADQMGSGDGALGMDGLSGPMGDGPDFDAFAAEGPGLHEHLMAQADHALSGHDLLLARALIDGIEDTGYLREPLLSISQRLGVALHRVEAVLSVVQGFDPAGVGARSLGECLAIQAREVDRYDPAMAVLLNNLDLLAEGRMAQLKRICGVDDEDLADMIRELRGYDPKPGLKFASARTEAVVPDVFVLQKPTGWVIELNSATLPRVVVNRQYHAELGLGAGKETKGFLSDCMAEANWLTRTLDQRQRTIIRVATELVKHQEGFFLRGVEALKPLTLRMIAEAIEMHESTVSRVTSNKYLGCARGVFELKYFFTSGVAASDGGEAVSAETVKQRIRALIMAEKPDAILSDDTLVELLKDEGFELARRTVAKYREAIGLGSSVQRRRQKAISARAA